MKLSIVATLYQSAAYVEEFCRRASAAARELVDDDYEIVLVNDGSPDNSMEVAVNLGMMDPHLIVVDLSRNFGHHKAMMAGLAQSSGSRVFLIDSDLEEEPEWLIGFARQMEEENCDVVYGIQEKRKGGWFEQWSGWIFYHIFRWATGVNIPSNIVVARIMTRRFVDALLQHKEQEIFFAGLLFITGFEQHPQLVTKHSSSPSTYSFRMKINQTINAVVSFSNTPLRAIFYSGVLISFLSLLSVVYIVIQWLFFQKPPAGWTSVVISVWLLGGITISFLGIVGIYMAKVFSETKNRPNVIVRQIFKKQKSQTC